MSSKRTSDRSPDLDRIAEDIPTTREDVEALRRARQRTLARYSLAQIDLLRLPDGLPRRPRRTAEGREPFEL